MNYQKIIASLAESPYVRNWAKQIIPKLDDMDVVDVIKDLDMLKDLFEEKFHNLTNKN